MILTTNRVTVFDEAVQSRIHLGIKYDQLSKKAKAEIWTAFIQQANKVSTTGVGSEISSRQLDDLSRKDFNGRQVRPSVSQLGRFFLLMGECRSRTRSAWLTLSRPPRAYRLDTTTLWRPLKPTKTLITIFAEPDRWRARRHIFRYIFSTCLLVTNLIHGWRGWEAFDFGAQDRSPFFFEDQVKPLDSDVLFIECP